MRKALDEAGKAEVAERKKEILARATEVIADGVPPFVVEVVEGVSDNKVLNEALKKYKSDAPTVPVLYMGFDEEKAVCLAQVPKALVKDKGIKASDWIDSFKDMLEARGGGRDESAQCSGPAVKNIGQAKAAALAYIQEKMA